MWGIVGGGGPRRSLTNALGCWSAFTVPANLKPVNPNWNPNQTEKPHRLLGPYTLNPEALNCICVEKRICTVVLLGFRVCSAPRVVQEFGWGLGFQSLGFPGFPVVPALRVSCRLMLDAAPENQVDKVFVAQDEEP